MQRASLNPLRITLLRSSKLSVCVVDRSQQFSKGRTLVDRPGASKSGSKPVEMVLGQQANGNDTVNDHRDSDIERQSTRVRFRGAYVFAASTSSYDLFQGGSIFRGESCQARQTTLHPHRFQLHER